MDKKDSFNCQKKQALRLVKSLICLKPKQIKVNALLIPLTSLNKIIVYINIVIKEVCLCTLALIYNNIVFYKNMH